MSGTVTVACKIPMGVILRVYDFDERDEPILGGGTKQVKVARQIGEDVKINGTAAPFGQFPIAQIASGAALTPNVDADFFAKWMMQNAGSDLVKNRMVISHDKTDSVVARAKNNESARSGMEPLVPDTDPRIPKKISTKAA